MPIVADSTLTPAINSASATVALTFAKPTASTTVGASAPTQRTSAIDDMSSAPVHHLARRRPVHGRVEQLIIEIASQQKCY